MKRLSFLILFILFNFTAFAQDLNPQVKKSAIFKDEYKNTSIIFSENDNNGNVIIAREYKGSIISQGKGYYVEVYDSDLKLLKDFEYPLNFTASQKDALLVGVVKFRNNLNFIHLFYDVKKKSFCVEATTLDVKDFKSSNKILYELPREETKKYGSFSLANIGNVSELGNGNRNKFLREQYATFSEAMFNVNGKAFGSEVNKGSSGVAITVNSSKTGFSVAMDLNGEKVQAVKLIVFDSDMEKKYDTMFQKNKSSGEYIFQSIELSDDGKEVFLVGKSFDQQVKKRGNDDYVFELTKFTNSSVISQTLDPQAKFIESLKIVLVQEQLYCLGFYSERNDDLVKGISCYKLDPMNLSVGFSKFSPFSDQFLADKYGESKDEELSNLTFRNYLITPSNAIVFNAEEMYAFGQYNTLAPVTRYTYKDIVSIKINADGELLWARNINKSQRTTEDDNAYVSYSSFLIGENVYFLLNAAERIRKLSNDRIKFGDARKSKYNLNLLRINDVGTFDFEEVLNDEQTETPFMVAKATSSGNSMFLLGQKGSKKQLLKITL